MKSYQVRDFIPKAVLDLPDNEWSKLEGKCRVFTVDVNLESPVENFKIEVKSSPTITFSFYLTSTTYSIKKSDWDKDLKILIGEIDNLTDLYSEHTYYNKYVLDRYVKSIINAIDKSFCILGKMLSDHDELVNSVDEIIEEYVNNH